MPELGDRVFNRTLFARADVSVNSDVGAGEQAREKDGRRVEHACDFRRIFAVVRRSTARRSGVLCVYSPPAL